MKIHIFYRSLTKISLLLFIAIAMVFYSCEMEAKPEPKLIIKNNSTADIDSFRIWKTSEEYSAAMAEWLLAQFSMIDNPEYMADLIAATAKVLAEKEKIFRSPPLIKATIKQGASSSWVLPRGLYLFKADSSEEESYIEEDDVVWVYENGIGLWQEF
jgi:hypothetical protein